MPTLARCLSTLIASGNGQDCNKIIDSLHKKINPESFKNGDKQTKILVAEIINPYLSDVEEFYLEGLWK